MKYIIAYAKLCGLCWYMVIYSWFKLGWNMAKGIDDILTKAKSS